MLKKILVLAPHTDDGEFGCGATISRLIREGAQVYYVAFSSCEQSLPEGLATDTLIKELYEATAILGIPKENVKVLPFKVRLFEENRQEILDCMINLSKEIEPDIVFSPSVNDIHQDHFTIATECLRAFKKTTIYQYQVPWNNYTFNNQMYYKVEDCDVEQKIKAIRCYKSQSNRDYVKEDFVKGLLRVHGVCIGAEYAEVYEVKRIII